MTADLGLHMEQPFDSKLHCYKWLREKLYGIPKSLRILNQGIEYILIQTSVPSELITVYGTESEIKWLDFKLRNTEMLTTKK